MHHSKEKENSPKPYEEVHFVETSGPVWNYSIFTEEAVNNFQQGTLYNAYQYFGNKQLEVLDTEGTYFAVWAPNATRVSIVGNFNNWRDGIHPLFVRLDKSGIWEGFIPGCKRGEVYKYSIHGFEGKIMQKGDPYAHFWEKKPLTASITWNFEYNWSDLSWMESREKHNSLQSPYAVYEVHLASWMRPEPFDEESYFSYWQIAQRLVPYVKQMGFTHVELMPVMEYPFDGSWGYQGTGYFAPTSRFGNPEEFMAMIDFFHQEGIGVILDWVPSHFPYDSHGLFMFDGTHTYEYADMRKGYHPDWNSYIFNYRRGEVRSFLISNARFWLDKFHIDGLRVDAVSSMLKLDYSRNEGEWEPNEFGGNGNIEAIAFLKDMNQMVYRDFTGVQTIAEEATNWPGVSRPTYADGLGFGMKWMMGWMHDTLRYFKQDPLYRQFQQNQLTFSMMYYHDENFMLPLSHDEVVHGKSPMIYKMPGDEWQKFANLRLLYTYMFAHPGAKLLFMGNEFAQTEEWNYKTSLRWDLLEHQSHAGMKACVSALAHLLKQEPALYEQQFNQDGFAWHDLDHREESVICFRRMTKTNDQELMVVLNLTPKERLQWTVGVNSTEEWLEIFNSDEKKYWGTGNYVNNTVIFPINQKNAGSYKIKISLPPLGGCILKRNNPNLNPP
ncbi:MAG: 1,4-alpha-glucan branching protein GlgB [Chitinophagaceae bacterium]|nr:1,4-alpha-glucan branching protein GlgB [Chitinophagaceae bacterium]